MASGASVAWEGAGAGRSLRRGWGARGGGVLHCVRLPPVPAVQSADPQHQDPGQAQADPAVREAEGEADLSLSHESRDGVHMPGAWLCGHPPDVLHLQGLRPPQGTQAQPAGARGGADRDEADI